MNEKIYLTKGDALAMIDLEKDFGPEGRLPVNGIESEQSSEEMIGTVVSLVKIFKKRSRFMFSCRDKHYPRHIEESIFPRHGVSKTSGHEYFDEILPLIQHVDMQLDKGMDPNIFSYSISTSPMFPALIQELRYRKVTSIFVTGLAYDYCVGESAIALACQNFEVYIVRDATRSVAEESAAVMDAKLKLYGVKTCFNEQIL